MKITLKSLISLCLTVLLLISTVACNSPVEPSTGNDTTAGMTEEQTTAEITTEDLTSEESRTETTELDLFYSLLPQALNLQNQSWFACPNYSPNNSYYGVPGKSRRYEEISPRVYWVKNMLNYTEEYLSGNELLLCEIYFGEVVDSYYEEFPIETGIDMIGEYLSTSLTWEEFVMIFERYRPILDANGVVYCEYENGAPSDNRDWFLQGRDKIIICPSLACILSMEQIQNLQIPEGYYMVIAPYRNIK